MDVKHHKPRRKGPPILTFAENCTGCLICEIRCSLRFLDEFNTSGAAIQVIRWPGKDRTFDVKFTEICDNCGLCARFCPYEALVWTKGMETRPSGQNGASS